MELKAPELLIVPLLFVVLPAASEMDALFRTPELLLVKIPEVAFPPVMVNAPGVVMLPLLVRAALLTLEMVIELVPLIAPPVAKVSLLTSIVVAPV